MSVSKTELGIDEGSTGTYTVKLNSEPTGEVTVGVSKATGSDADVQVSPASLRFTAANWDDAQTVTVEAAQDTDAADDAATIAHTANGGDYQSVAGPTVKVTVDDDETASTTVALSVEPQTVAEDVGTAGQTMTVEATLNQAPRTVATAVTVSVAGGTATVGDDFAAVSDVTVTIAAGMASGTGTFHADTGERRSGRVGRDGDAERHDPLGPDGDSGDRADADDRGRRRTRGVGVGDDAGDRRGRQQALHGGVDLTSPPQT